MPSAKVRLDDLLVERGFYPTVALAGRAVLAGEVTSPSISVLKPGMLVAFDIQLTVRPDKPYVSRGGEKLAAALIHFKIDTTGWHCLDIGAGSGGFTDCLLKNGAARVTAIDVGYGQFDWQLRQDPRVELLERTNFRMLAPIDLKDSFDFAVADLSFIRTSSLLALIRLFLKPTGQMVILIKPQFELPREQAYSPGCQGGIVVDRALHQHVLQDFLSSANKASLVPRGLISSPLKGADGNREFLFWATLTGIPATIDLQTILG
ncbi:MAG: TlyA family RNA methyltransferase [Coriobacteriales bacterium]|jgi:23S rRNA (cytidine1920-2'-O)/16S rRNA (cytidine1409-2'-O)-methyltransferase|nr:TlyA family RNA methyltransferase [Coriobacteriales bacterium]